MATVPQELLQQALKGQAPALKELFAQAEQLLAAQDPVGALALFKESAICYRIAAFRERAKAEELERSVSDLETKLDFTRKLLAKPVSYFQVPCLPDADLAFATLARAWHQLDWNEDLAAAAMCVTALWRSQGERFSSPGGSPTRRMIYSVGWMLEQARDIPPSSTQQHPSEQQMLLMPLVHAMAALLGSESSPKE